MAEGHLCNMGRMIEDMESKLRNSLEQVPSPFSLFLKPWQSLPSLRLSLSLSLSLSLNSNLHRHIEFWVLDIW
jgi:hypothetical protein